MLAANCVIYNAVSSEFVYYTRDSSSGARYAVRYTIPIDVLRQWVVVIR